MALPQPRPMRAGCRPRRAPVSRRGRWRNCQSRRRPRGLGWLSVVGPGVIVLGLSIGSGEFLLGPAVFVRHGLTLLWVTSDRDRPADDLQSRSHALHAGDRRAGVHRLHAHAALVDAVGNRLHGRCISSSSAGRRLPARRPAGCSSSWMRRLPEPADARRDLRDRRRHLPRRRVLSPDRPPHRPHARSPQLGAGGDDTRRVPDPGAAVRAGAGVGGRRIAR